MKKRDRKCDTVRSSRTIMGNDDDSVGVPSVGDDSHKSQYNATGDSTTNHGEGSGWGGDSGDGEKSSTQQQRLGSKETSRVNRAKFVAYFVLLTTATGVAYAVFHYMTNVEATQFKIQFGNDSRKILDNVGRGIVNSLAVLDNFAFVAVSLAKFFRKDKGIPAWPFVSIPDFGLRVAKDRSSCSGITFSFQPVLVGHEQRLEWEKFTANTTHQKWVNQTKRTQETDNNYFGTSTYDVPERVRLWSRLGDVPYNTTQQIFMPQWQNYPANSPSFNRDWLNSKTSNASLAVINTHRAVVSEAYMLPDPNDKDEMQETQYYASIFSSLLKPGQNAIEPVSDFIYPIIEAFDGVRTPDNPKVNRIVATVITTVYWREYISRALPESSLGIVVVVENPCNPAFTYQVNGPDVIYLGRGDHHNPKYDSLKVSRLISELQLSETRESRYSGVPLNDEHCPFTINIYPSDEMKNSLTTNNPVVFTICVVVIFTFGALVFYAYDASVERRQSLVLAAAEKTNTIVSSLFPATIRDQIMNVEGTRKNELSNGRCGAITSSKAIADLFADTTVFFADLAGFHEWSSSRCPRDVFELLESLYSAMDTVAKKRKVFKVETIGDCYVAVTGLPDPVPNHAVIIARFAIECVELAKLMTTQLATSLGPDTANLLLRVGLNSGPTTAGVLRGEKARFQLFGDTVNTAARMETSGKPGRIHASQKTADLLIKAGKERWVTKREDIVSVKGKGTMITYWVHSRSLASSSHESEESKHDPLQRQLSIKSSLIDWNAEIFIRHLKRLVILRWLSDRKSSGPTVSSHSNGNASHQSTRINQGEESFDFVPFEYDAMAKVDIGAVNLHSSVESQLRDFITLVVRAQRANPDHEFEQSCLVLLSIQKIFEQMDQNSGIEQLSMTTVSLLKLVDPLSQLAISFAALVRYANHPELPTPFKPDDSPNVANSNPSLVQRAKDLDTRATGWSLLMQSQFEDLRKAMFANESELILFQKIVKKALIAADTVEVCADSTNLRLDKANDDSMLPSQLVEYIMQVSVRHHSASMVIM